MSGNKDDLPPEIAAKLMACLREVNGKFEVADSKALVNLVAEYGERHPTLLDLFNIDLAAVVEHFKGTGEVLPGIQIVHTETREGENWLKR